jgi:fibronectin-binding autotransporter adhesin
MKRFTTATLAIFAVAILASQSVQATQRTWNSIGTDWNTAANWTGGAPTVTNAVGVFNTVESVQPNLSASVSIAGIYFFGTGSSGYDITSTGGAVFTLNGTDPTGAGGTSNASAAAIRSEITSGTNTVDAPVNLGAAAAATQVFFQAAGGTLIVNGVVSSTNAVTLSLKGTGTIELNGANTFTSGSNINDAGTTLVIGNDNALGTGTFSMGSSGTLQAGGGARTLANAIVLGGNTTLSGSNAFTFNGNFTSSGSSTRTLTVSNTGGATLAGNVFLSENNSTAGRVFIINGSAATTISGVITNNNVGNTLAAGLRYSGTSTLTLSNTNTYGGGTAITVAGGAITATKDGAFGTGNVSLATTGGVTLTLQGGATNNYISDFANLILITGNTVNLNFTGTDDTIGQLIVNGASQAAGEYGAVGSGAPNELALLFGTGRLNVIGIPEPATTMLIGLGLLIGAQRLRRKTG